MAQINLWLEADKRQSNGFVIIQECELLPPFRYRTFMSAPARMRSARIASPLYVCQNNSMMFEVTGPEDVY
jgi:hypothetical protein